MARKFGNGYIWKIGSKRSLIRTKADTHTMKKLLYKILRYSGMVFIFREIIQRNKVTMLLYHDISRETAEKTFPYLKKRYNVISLGDFLAARSNPNSHPLPKKALVITFDDGHIRNHQLLPVARNMNLPITIFLCAGIINTKRHFWFTYKHPNLSKAALKRASNKQRLKMLREVGFTPDREFQTPQAMNREQILEAKHHFDLQAHTMSHPCLPRCTDAEAHEEIVASKQVLENDYGLKVNAIAYPNGDYSDRDVALAKEAGYQCGITVDFGYNTLKTDPFKLKRLSVNDTSNLDELAVKASGVWQFFKTKNGKKQNYGWTDRVEH
jgi:peptidoglycan/xylan/chitin deacetylase (PgdA/CDA1 family)